MHSTLIIEDSRVAGRKQHQLIPCSDNTSKDGRKHKQFSWYPGRCPAYGCVCCASADLEYLAASYLTVEAYSVDEVLIPGNKHGTFSVGCTNSSKTKPSRPLGFRTKSEK